MSALIIRDSTQHDIQPIRKKLGDTDKIILPKKVHYSTAVKEEGITRERKRDS
jgi:hypothetical protein